jgi:hypothetical protein
MNEPECHLDLTMLIEPIAELVMLELCPSRGGMESVAQAGMWKCRYIPLSRTLPKNLFSIKKVSSACCVIDER